MKRFTAFVFCCLIFSTLAKAHCNLATGYTLIPSFTRDCDFMTFHQGRLLDEKRLFTGYNNDMVCRDLKLEREYDRNITPQVVACYQWAANRDLKSCNFNDLKDSKIKFDLSKEQNSKWQFILSPGVTEKELEERESKMNSARISYLKTMAPKLVACFTEQNLTGISEENLENLLWGFIVSARLNLIPNLPREDVKIEKWGYRGDHRSKYFIKFNGIQIDANRTDDDEFTLNLIKY